MLRSVEERVDVLDRRERSPPKVAVCVSAQFRNVPYAWRTVNVLEAPPPRFAAEEVATIAARLFGIEGTATSLGSERDQTFLIDDGADGGGVIKVSNLGEDPAVLDLETEAVIHVVGVDPELPVARPRPAAAGAPGPAAYPPTVEGADGLHFVRLLEPQRGHLGGTDLDAHPLAHVGPP